MTTKPSDASQWLAAGVPLTLLIDLLDSAGPDSPRIYRDEPADLDWAPRPSAT